MGTGERNNIQCRMWSTTADVRCGNPRLGMGGASCRWMTLIPSMVAFAPRPGVTATSGREL